VVTERTIVSCRVAQVRVAHGVYGESLLFRVRHVGDESLAPNTTCSRARAAGSERRPSCCSTRWRRTSSPR
jgi:hypothetical protein